MTIKSSGISRRDIERAMGLPYSGRDDEKISSFTTDSRDAEKGSVFVAIKGQQRDGNDFCGVGDAGGRFACHRRGSAGRS